MDEHALALLEFPRVIAEVADLCASPMGTALLRRQEVLTSAKDVAERLVLAGAFRSMLENGSEPPGLDFPDVSEVLPRLGKEGLQLEGEELAAIGRCILSGLKLRRHILKVGEAGVLAPIAASIPDLSALSRAIFHMLDHEGLLRERQIPALAAIRERITAQPR